MEENALSIELHCEIGNTEERELIREELTAIVEAFSKQVHPIESVKRIVIPEDFDSAIQLVVNNASYRSIRDSSREMAVGKTVWHGDTATIYVSKNLYTEHHDTRTRSFFLFHEFSHCIAGQFKPAETETNLDTEFLTSLNSNFDEYRANRFSWSIIGRPENESHRLVELARSGIAGFYDHLCGEESLMRKLESGICSFKYGNITIEAFQRDFIPIAHSIILSHTYLYSYIDSELIWLSDESESIQKQIHRFNVYNHLRDLIIAYRNQYSLTSWKWYSKEDSWLWKTALQSLGITIEEVEEGYYIGVDFL